ncbi:MAG: arsenite methyltransferase [Candidatus Eisenbacteria bacterium]
MSKTIETSAQGGDIRTVVREKYGSIAEGRTGCCSATATEEARQSSCGAVGCCGVGDGEAVLAQIGYTAEQAASLPEGANLGLGCGNPLAHAALQPGEVVLDLGSGAGIDCFLAAREVGATGRAIGVDMTAAMIEKARANAAKSGANNVEFRLGEIEHLPLADASVDVIISNCVVNLSPEKAQVFRESLRVLRPGGRMLISDLVLTRPLTREMQNNVDLYVGCVAGASLKDDYLRLMREAGFADVEVVAETGYSVGQELLQPGSAEADAFHSVVSAKIRARKP